MEMPKEELAQKKIRRAGIDNARLPLTDVIKLFVDRDKPTDPRKYYSKVTYRIQMELCGIPKGGRDTSTGALLLKVGGLEQIAELLCIVHSSKARLFKRHLMKWIRQLR